MRFLAEVAPITGPMYQLFIFFMITDPKTTVKPRWAQCLVAVLVAVVEMILRLAENVHAPYYALTIVGPIAQPHRNLVDLQESALGLEVSGWPHEMEMTGKPG